MGLFMYMTFLTPLRLIILRIGIQWLKSTHRKTLKKYFLVRDFLFPGVYSLGNKIDLERKVKYNDVKAYTDNLKM